MKFRYRTTLLTMALALVTAITGSTTAFAADKKDDASKHNITSEWIMWVKRGQDQAFEAAVKKYAAWRKDQGENMHWDIYQPIVGSDLDHYVIRSESRAWGDYDANMAWSQEHKAGPQYMQDVAPYVMREKHYFSSYDVKRSHWIKDEGYRYYGVTTYHFKSGSWPDVKNVLEKVHKAVTDAKWPYGYAVEYTIGGHGGMSIVTPMKTMAEMDDPEPTLMSVMTKALGSKEKAEALFQKFSASIDKRDFTIYMHRADLSTPK